MEKGRRLATRGGKPISHQLAGSQCRLSNPHQPRAWRSKGVRSRVPSALGRGNLLEAKAKRGTKRSGGPSCEQAPNRTISAFHWDGPRLLSSGRGRGAEARASSQSEVRTQRQRPRPRAGWHSGPRAPNSALSARGAATYNMRAQSYLTQSSLAGPLITKRTRAPTPPAPAPATTRAAAAGREAAPQTPKARQYNILYITSRP
jgi:hypothetical protein